MEQVRAMRLEIQSFARGVSREKNAKRILCRIGVEPALDFLSPHTARQPVDHLDALVGPISAFDRLLEDGLEVPFRPLAVFRENQDAAVIPLRSTAARRQLAPRRQLET